MLFEHLSPSALRAALAIVAVLGLSGCPDDPPAPVPDAALETSPAAHLEERRGTVTLEREGKASPAQLGYLFIGDAIETAEDAEAKVRFSGGRVVEVGSDARFTLGEGEGGLVLKIERGLVLTRVPNDERGAKDATVALSILTPFGLTRIGQSEVQVDVGKDSATVEVKVGTIELVSRSGEVTRASAGEKVSLGEKPQAAASIVLPVVQVTIVAAGKAEVKKKDAKAWVAMGKKESGLAAGDQLRVKDGRVTLKAEGSNGRLVFGRGAEAGFSSVARGDGVEETDLELRKGELSGVMASGQKSKLKLGGGVSLVSDLGGQFSLLKTGAGIELSALAGDFRLEREGAPAQEIKGGQSAKLNAKDQTVQLIDASRESIAFPTREGMKVFHSGMGKISIAWDGEENKAYRIEVASGPTFTEPLLAGVVHQQFVSVVAPLRGNLYWRVFDGDKELDKGSAHFSPEVRGSELDVRRNDVQDGADKTTIYYQDKPPAVTFNFAADPAAAQYKVSVFKEGALGTPVIEKTVKEAKVVLDGALAEGNYLWSATPLDATGAGLRGGKMNKLELAYDNAVPNLTIKSPRNGDPGGAKVPVVGIAPVGAKVFVNGKAVALDDKARFDAVAAPLAGGRLVFRMVSKSGAEVYTVRTVRR